MILSKHISFYYIPSRLIYIYKILENANGYSYKTDIFIHTNVAFDLNFEYKNKYTNGKVEVIFHDLSNENPFYLTWKCRKLMKEQRNDYSIFMYLEDDILVPSKAIEYFIKYNKILDLNYNLGFIRIEVNDAGEEFSTDIRSKLNKYIHFKSEKYALNNDNPYCAFWIYTKEDFNKFVDSKYWDIKNVCGYQIRESSAIGLHGLSTKWYQGTIIPILNNKLHPDSRIYHLPNNYINDGHFGSIKFEELTI